MILLKLYYLLTIFQQAGYNVRLFLKSQIKKYLIISFPYLFLFLFSYYKNITFLFLYGFSIPFIFYYVYKLKKKLVFTKRMIRLILVILLLIISFFFIINFYVGIFLELFILFADLLLLWPESIINKSYIKKAIKKSEEIRGVKIAITGSFGKTSTKNYLNDILSKKYLVKFSPSSYNTPLGIAKFLNNNNFSFCDFVIYEFGSKRFGDISTLGKYYEYDIAVITDIGFMHLDTFKNIENIIEEKMSILANLKNKGLAILNFENKYIREYAKNCNYISYGFNYGNYQARNIDVSIDGSSFDLYINDLFYQRITIKPLGRQAILNIMPSIILAIKYNIDFNFISHINEVKHRLSIKKIDNYVILDDAYNANLNGALYALEVMKSYKGKKFIITPGFVEMRSINLYLCEKFSEGINQCVDICILENNSFTRRLKKYINIECFFVKNFKEGYNLFLNMLEDNSILLIENDLPDFY